MTARLLETGFSVRAWNRNKEKAESLQADGADVAESPAAAAQGADLCCLCLTDAKAVRDVLFGENGAANRLKPGALVIDFSTIGVSAAQELARDLARTDVDYIDAPVSGGPGAARKGELAIMCGGSDEAVVRAQDVFEALGRKTTHVGAVGAGQAAKLCNQLIVSANLMAISEAVTLARALGIDPNVLPIALAGGYADSMPLQVFAPRMAEGALEPRISQVATMLKDAKEITKTAEGLPVTLRLTQQTLALYQEAASRGWAGDDLAVLPRLSAPHSDATS